MISEADSAPMEVVTPTRRTDVMMAEEIRPEPPFLVIMASYVVDFHHRNVCPKCSPDSPCPRLTEAGDHLRAWRDRRDRQS